MSARDYLFRLLFAFAAAVIFVANGEIGAANAWVAAAFVMQFIRHSSTPQAGGGRG